MKQKGSSDVKGSLWNHLDKKVILWHREAPLFLRVKSSLSHDPSENIVIIIISSYFQLSVIVISSYY